MASTIPALFAIGTIAAGLFWKYSKKHRERSQETPSVSGKERASEEVQWASELAADPRTNPDRLRALALFPYRAVRQAVASNPNTPIEALQGLAQNYPENFLKNPALPILLLENPSFFRSMSPESAQSLARHVDLSPELCKILAFHESSFVRMDIAARTDASPATLALLASDSDVQVRMNVARNANVPHAIYFHLMTDPNPLVRVSAAENPSALEEDLGELVIIGNDKTCLAVAGHPRATPEILSQLAKHPMSEVRKKVAAHRRTPVTVLKRLAKEDQLVDAVASNPSAPADLLLEIAKFAKFPWTLAKALKNRNMPQDVLDRYSRHPDREMRCAVALNPSTSVKTLRRLVLDYQDIAEKARMTLSILFNETSGDEP